MFCRVIKELTLLQRDGVDLHDGHWSVELFMCGDQKFQQQALGIVQASGNYSCIYCLVHADDRGDGTLAVGQL